MLKPYPAEHVLPQLRNARFHSSAALPPLTQEAENPVFALDSSTNVSRTAASSSLELHERVGSSTGAIHRRRRSCGACDDDEELSTP
jgi:hypothetical protein